MEAYFSIKHEQKLLTKLQKKYLLTLAVTVIVTVEEMFIANMSNPESIDMQAYMVTQARFLSDFTYDPTLPVMLLSTNAANSDPAKRPIKLYERLITNEDCQSIKLISGDSLSIYYQPKPILEQVSSFMKANY